MSDDNDDCIEHTRRENGKVGVYTTHCAHYGKVGVYTTRCAHNGKVGVYTTRCAHNGTVGVYTTRCAHNAYLRRELHRKIIRKEGETRLKYR